MSSPAQRVRPPGTARRRSPCCGGTWRGAEFPSRGCCGSEVDADTLAFPVAVARGFRSFGTADFDRLLLLPGLRRALQLLAVDRPGGLAGTGEPGADRCGRVALELVHRKN